VRPGVDGEAGPADDLLSSSKVSAAPRFVERDLPLAGRGLDGARGNNPEIRRPAFEIFLGRPEPVDPDRFGEPGTGRGFL